MTPFDFLKQFSEKNQKIWDFILKTNMNYSWLTPHLVKINQIYFLLLQYYFFHPLKWLTLQQAYGIELLSLWQTNVAQSTDVKPDKRFAHTAWNNQAVFVAIKQIYFLFAKYLNLVVEQMDDLDGEVKKQIHFYIQQLIDTCAPTNFAITNPEVLEKMCHTQGENILHGLDNLIQDLQQNHDFLQIRMTDLNAFTIGENIAVTPGKVIYQNDLIQLLQYELQTKKVYQIPFLIIPPWINKYYILDLNAQKSFVDWLVKQGYTVFMISWKNPDKTYAHKNFSDYMQEGPVAAIQVIKKITQEDQVNTLGFCIGGTLLACTLAYLAEKKDNSIKSATYLATMLDFSEPGDLGNLLHDAQQEAFAQEIKDKGFYSGKNMAQTFNLLRANDLIWSFYIKNYLLGEDPPAFDLLFWNSDSTNLPASMYEFYLTNFYIENNLAQGNLILNKTNINLKNITIPVFFLSTELDHIAPWQSTYKGALLHGGPVIFALGKSGHIAGIVNPPNANKYGFYVNETLPAAAKAWFDQAIEHQGSWWPYWEKWLQNLSGKKVIARIPGNANHTIIEVAPGSYVKADVN